MENRVCRNCGFAFDEGDLCPICGAEFEQSDEARATPESADEPDQSPEEPAKPPKKSKKPLLLRTAVILCAVVCAVMIACTATLTIFINRMKNELRSEVLVSASNINSNLVDNGWVAYDYDDTPNYSLDLSEEASQIYKYGSVSIDKVTTKLIDEESNVAKLSFTFILANTSEDEITLNNAGFSVFPMYAYISSYTPYSYSSYVIVAFDFGEDGHTLTLKPGEKKTVSFVVAGGSPEGDIGKTVNISWTLSGNVSGDTLFTLDVHGFVETGFE